MGHIGVAFLAATSTTVTPAVGLNMFYWIQTIPLTVRSKIKSKTYKKHTIKINSQIFQSGTI